MPVKTKICGLRTPETIDAAIKHGTSHIGLNFYPPSPRSISFDEARALVGPIPHHVRRVGVFVDPCNALLEQAIEAGNLDVIQLHKTTPGRAAAIRAQCERETWSAIGIRTADDLKSAAFHIGASDFLLYDTLQPDDAALPGGMGVRFDWTLLAGFVHPMAWGLAGGLTPNNVAEAIRVTGAQLVDTSSGVESAPGIKDVDKIAAFLKAAARL
ncbi:MAG: phosphoribosylanthranilate isomerase [Sphingomonadaceae bacterium]